VLRARLYGLSGVRGTNKFGLLMNETLTDGHDNKLK